MFAAARALLDKTTTNIAQAYGAADITSQAMRTAVTDWFALYFQREVTDYEDPCQRLPYTIVNKLSKTTFSRYSSTYIDLKNSHQAWLDYNRSAFDTMRKEAMQWLLVGGEVLLKPIAVPGQQRFRWQCIRRDGYVVLGRRADGMITDLCCIEQHVVNKRYYTLVERRTVDSAGYLTICNKLYSSDNTVTLGMFVPLGTLSQYAMLLPEYTYPVPVYSIGVVQLRTPTVNCVDGSADGVSIYEPAVGLIHNINRNELQLSDEFDLGRLRVMTNDEFLMPISGGKKIIKDTLFVGGNINGANFPMQSFAPQLRIEAYEARKQSYLCSLENIIGLKRGILSRAEAVERTKQEITSSAGDYALSVEDLQNVWYDGLQEAMRICSTLGAMYRYCGRQEADRDALSVTWGNGVLYDAQQEMDNDLKLVQAGLLLPEIALAKRLDLPYDTPEDLAYVREHYMPELEKLTQ